MKNVDIARFERLVKTSEKLNAKEGNHRFYPIRSTEIIGKSTKTTRILVFGMYDYKTKKYILSRPFIDVNKSFDEIEVMLREA